MSYKEDAHAYDDIIDFPHHISAKHPQMSSENRAAQFSAFAALSGFDAAITETARLTDKRIDLDEGHKEIINTKLKNISDHISQFPLASITYFSPDEKKDGGAYITLSENIKKVDTYEKVMVTVTGRAIPIEDIYDLEGDILRHLDSNDG